MDYQLLNRTIGELVGHRCESADNPHGSIIRLDIGTMTKPADAEPSALRHGWRHVTIFSPWRVVGRSAVEFDWNEPGGPTGTLGRRLLVLEGTTVVAASVAQPANDLSIGFSNGLVLEVFADIGDDREDAWFVLGTDGLELGVRPNHPE